MTFRLFETSQVSFSKNDFLGMSRETELKVNEGEKWAECAFRVAEDDLGKTKAICLTPCVGGGGSGVGG